MSAGRSGHGPGVGIMLSRLGIRQKLGLLLVIPLAAVALVLVPFTAERIAQARSAGVTARTATTARDVGALIQALQQERLLALGYLATPTLDTSTLLVQSQVAVNETAQLRRNPQAADVMRAATPALDGLVGVRTAVLSRAISARATYGAYRAATASLLDALRLTQPLGADAAGIGQLGALDSLMRSNEEACSVGALLVASAADPALSTLLTAAVTADEQNLRRFHDLVEPSEAALVDTVQEGAAGQRIRQLINELTASGRPSSVADVSGALTAAVTYTGLRRLAQDRVARDIATAAQSRASAAQITAWGVAAAAAALLATVIALGTTVSTSISRPLRRLTRAAGVVAELSRAELVRVADSDLLDPAPPRLAAVDVRSSDEIGELATALNRVQATAALLLERQTSSRRNVAVMFANIARRTQNLVGRQLTVIDDLERNERSPELLQRLYRLDHLATRLRRSADSLLVVSGTIDQVVSGAPTPLIDIIRSALAEIEGFRAVEIGEISTVAVNSTVVGDLRLLLAELLENATNFSPPGSSVTIAATLAEECHLVIVDHGLGMSAARLDEENRRLVERERLELAPTTVLGLFVVGRLARRHGFDVRLEPSEGRGITAHVRVPTRLLTVGPIVGLPPAPLRTRRPAPHPALDAIDAIEVDVSDEPFAWFATSPELVAIGSAGPRAHGERDEPTSGSGAEPEAVMSPSAIGRASLASVDVTRDPAAAEPPAAFAPKGPAEGSHGLPRRIVTPAEGLEPAATAANGGRGDEAPLTHRGLTRRLPGRHLMTEVEFPVEEPTEVLRPRDPEAEREAVNDYLAGLSRGEDPRASAEEAQ